MLDRVERTRFAESLAIGEWVDSVFQQACAERGIDPSWAITAPLDWLAAMPATETVQ